ncbi:MAG: leucyl aminopeptidase family protein [Thiotrichales bacterium]|nr:leucyl aminopeptidase family protein [Thiotrichales bacterium]
MDDLLCNEREDDSIAVVPIDPARLEDWRAHAIPETAAWARNTGFSAKPGSTCLVPGRRGKLAGVLVGADATDDPWALAGVPEVIPAGAYHLDSRWSSHGLERAALGWALAAYRFTRYRKQPEPPAARLFPGSVAAAETARRLAGAVARVRDLINTPANDMMPKDLAAAVSELATRHGADIRVVTGQALLDAGYPAIHAVGRASTHRPRLIDLTWGDPQAPCLTLLGKGVCFDSGGLDIKPASGMRLMKKDMGGAAHAIGLADLVMSAALPVRLRLLVPAVENAIAGNAYRPGDVLATRKGLTVEVDNTDAEGRIVLSDALTEGAADTPDLMVDFATLTGAARIALGTELPAMFCNDEAVAAGIAEAGRDVHDEVWRMPLHAPYRALIESKVADIANSASQPHGGAITAALFLQAFVPDVIPWAHFDIMAWNTKAKPARPVGGEAMALRAVFEFLERRYRT